MKTIDVGNGRLTVPEIALGCMRIPGLKGTKEIRRLVDTAMDQGINFFDHADIYGAGEAEAMFAEAVKGIPREKMIIQTKCGIRSGVSYDFSKEHILRSVEGSLRRLGTDHVDILLLHRPDALMEEEEVAEAFTLLEEQGKVRYFGVSNQNAMQIALMNSWCGNKILFDQLQFSVAHCDIIDSGIHVNVHHENGADRSGSVIEYCRLHHITIQAWSPFQYGMFEGVFLGHEKFPELNRALERLAEKYDATPNAIAVAWILRHPARIQTIVGSTNAERVVQICKASDIRLTREEWYELYMAAGKQLP